MGGDYHLKALSLRLVAVRERLNLERTNILQLYPARKYQNRAAYGFAYIRTERVCIDAIKARMREVSWLPARLDESSDINSATRDQMARWIRQGENLPNEDIFGNAFVHALTRCSLVDTEYGETTKRLADRIALLFRDLTCLVAALHCCHILSEMQVERVKLTLPQDISRVALDLTIMTETLLAMQDAADEDDGEADIPLCVGNENKKLPPDYLRLVSDCDQNLPA